MSTTMPASLTVQLITVAIVTLQRQLIHNELANRNAWNMAYDFIIVGAGGAGCVLASRLSENPNFSVLLIEAGGPETVTTDMPAETLPSAGSPEYGWNYASVPQNNIGKNIAFLELSFLCVFLLLQPLRTAIAACLSGGVELWVARVQ